MIQDLFCQTKLASSAIVQELFDMLSNKANNLPLTTTSGINSITTPSLPVEPASSPRFNISQDSALAPSNIMFDPTNNIASLAAARYRVGITFEVSTPPSRISHACLKTLFVLSARGGQEEVKHDCLLFF